MSTSDATPLLGQRTSLPNNRAPGVPSDSNPNSSPNKARGFRPSTNNNNNRNQRHWSDESEDISTRPDTDPYGYQNSGPGYRRRGGQPSDLDAQRFSGQNRPTGLKKLLCGCCCLPCQRAYARFQNRYSKTEKYAMGFAVLFFSLAIVFFLAFVRALDAVPESGKNGICTSRECTIVAADILRDMKPGVDPCTDFFDFICGGFVDRVPIPDDKPKIGYGDLIHQHNKEIIKGILTPDSKGIIQRAKDDARKRNLVKLQTLYESCTDEKKLSDTGVKPLVDQVDKMVKTLPAANSVLSPDASPFAFKILEEINDIIKSFKDDITRLQNHGEEELAAGGGGGGGGGGEGGGGGGGGGDDGDDNQDGNGVQKEELALAISQLTLVGVKSPIDFNVAADPKNPDVSVLFIREAGLGLPSKQAYEDEKIVEVYQKVVEDMFVVVMGKGKDKDKDKDESDNTKPTKWAEIAKNIVKFEKLLAGISSSPEDLQNKELTYNPRTLAQVYELVPTVDWKVILEQLHGKGFNDPDPIIVSMPDYLEKLNKLFKDTPALTLQNYFVWRLIQNLAPNLAVELQKPILRLKATLEGVSDEILPARWEKCVSAINDALGPMAGYYYIEKAFTGDSKDMAEDIMTSLRTAFSSKISTIDWLDNETRSNATEKVDLLTQKIGYSTSSPDVRSAESLEEHFKDLQLNKTDFFGNQIRAKTWFVQKLFSDLEKPLDRTRWRLNPQTVDAYYNPSANEIVFPAGFLQQPYFHVDNPEYLNYGSIGGVFGHELTHAFDNIGRLYDSKGRLENWWSNATLQEFHDRSQCFIDQYGNYTVKDPQGRENHVNGKLTVGENLADNGGLRRAFDAWQARYKSDPRGNKYKNHLLAGLGNYTREQLFYISYARGWCSQRRPASAVEGLRTEVHPPPKWRANGALHNSEHFAKLFHCKPRSGMNPDKKCEMW